MVWMQDASPFSSICHIWWLLQSSVKYVCASHIYDNFQKVTPTGYSIMTSMLAGVSKEKLLVILEGGYNLRSISSSATEVVKVLLGDSTNFGIAAAAPSKEGLETVLQVLKVQQQFWPVLDPACASLSLQAQQGSVFSKYTKKRNKLKEKKHLAAPRPLWWKLGSKRLLYEALFEGRRLRKIKATDKGKADTAEQKMCDVAES